MELTFDILLWATKCAIGLLVVKALWYGTKGPTIQDLIRKKKGDRMSEPQENLTPTCGCVIHEAQPTRPWHAAWIEFCPIHKAAPEMLEALDNTARWYHALGATTTDGHKQPEIERCTSPMCRDNCTAIAQAKKEGGEA